jgi:4-carboxymuconolactone decarboxylase
VSRLLPLPPDGLTPAQRAIHDAVTGGRRADGPFRVTAPDGSLLGPFGPMLRSPAIGDTVQRLGEQLRYDSVLPTLVREVAILTVARGWRSEFEWYAHAAVGRRAGLPEDVLDALRDGRRPVGLDEAQAAAHDVCVALDTRRRVPEEVYQRALDQLGEQGVAELAFLYGYYALVAATLATFEIDQPEGEPPAFTS